jgi:hypothetical protein
LPLNARLFAVCRNWSSRDDSGTKYRVARVAPILLTQNRLEARTPPMYHGCRGRKGRKKFRTAGKITMVVPRRARFLPATSAHLSVAGIARTMTLH